MSLESLCGWGNRSNKGSYLALVTMFREKEVRIQAWSVWLQIYAISRMLTPPLSEYIWLLGVGMSIHNNTHEY